MQYTCNTYATAIGGDVTYNGKAILTNQNSLKPEWESAVNAKTYNNNGESQGGIVCMD